MESENKLTYPEIINDGGFSVTVEGETMEFFLEPHISTQRYRAMQKLELELSYGLTFKNMYERLQECYELLNNQRFADSAVMIRDMIEGAHSIDDENNWPTIMKYAALILNTEEENRQVYDEKAMDKKIQIWSDTGVPIQCFFGIVLHSVNGLMKNYKENIHNTSKKEKEQKGK